MAALGVALLAACGTTASPTDATAGHNQVPESYPVNRTPPTSSPSAAPGGSCAAGSLRITLGHGEGAAGHFSVPVVFTNDSSAPCTISGYPGIAYVSGPDGQPVGDPATQIPGPSGPVRLAPGGTASALLNETDVDVYPAATCGPTPVAGLRVTAPGTGSPAFVAQPNARACAKHLTGGQSQLKVRPVVTGSSGQ